MIRAVIFDMDGLLIDSEPIWFRIQAAIYKDLGIDFTRKQHAGLTGLRSKEVVEKLYRQHPWDGPSVEDVAADIQKQVIAAIKKEITLKPGVHRALTVCKKAGLPVAIASSSTAKVIDAVVDTLGIREHFEHIYSAQFEEYGKPHPSVFLKAAELLKTPPHSCLVFEDSPNGVLAAKAAKMVCVAVPETPAKDHAFIGTADAVLGSLLEFDQKLLGRLGRAA